MADLDDEFLRFQAELADVEVAVNEQQSQQNVALDITSEPEHAGLQQQGVLLQAQMQATAHHGVTEPMQLPQARLPPPSAPPVLVTRPGPTLIPPPPFAATGGALQVPYSVRPPVGFMPQQVPGGIVPPAAMLPPPMLIPIPYTPAGFGGPAVAHGMPQRTDGYSGASTSSMPSGPAPTLLQPLPAAPVPAAPSAPVLTEAQKAKAAKIEEKKKKGLLRQAAGQRWRDPTLLEWPENDFRIFVGDLGTEVSDELLARAFKQYTSFAKAKIVRDKRTNKSKGFGFVSFLDSADFAKALREMNGKYIGNRPCKLSKSTWDDRTGSFKRKDGTVVGGPVKAKKPKH